MRSPTGGEDKDTDPPRPYGISPEIWERMLVTFGQIAGKAAVPVWIQGTTTLPLGPGGRIFVYADNGDDGSLPWVQAIADEVVKRLSRFQDNALPEPEPISLREMEDSPATKKVKRENRILGLRWSSAIRRFKRAGIDRAAALQGLAASYSRPASVIAILVKHACNARWKRVERMRSTLVPIWEARGAGVFDIARKLNVTPNYARRLRAEIHWKIETAKEA